MHNPFSRTLRSLESDGPGRAVPALVLAAVLLVLWGAWLGLARVAVYAVTEVARIEVDREAHPVQTPAGGRVVAVRMALDQAVTEGEVLLELDAEPQRLRILEEEARLAGLTRQLEALQAEVGSGARALSQGKAAAGGARGEGAARLREAEAAARLAQQEADRLRRLHAGGNLAEAEMQRALALAEQRRAAADALALAVSRQKWDLLRDQSDRERGIDELLTEQAELESGMRSAEAALARLRTEADERRILAPVAGRLAEVAPVRVGQVLAPGERVGAVLPPGDLKILAWFAPPDALGRVEAGQPAQLRLAGFPWTQYGAIDARVARVSRELRDGKVRVELDLVQPDRSPIPLQHGLPGTVQVEVERVTPAVLALRAAGRLVEAAPPADGGARGP